MKQKLLKNHFSFSEFYFLLSFIIYCRFLVTFEFVENFRKNFKILHLSLNKAVKAYYLLPRCPKERCSCVQICGFILFLLFVRMTLYHFGNCLALVYVPYYLTYKYSGLSEYGTFWKCVQSGIMYMLTQLCKMMVLATFFPTSDVSEGFFGEFCKTSVDFADLVGIYLVLSSIPGKGHAKVLTAGIGWAGAEIILTRCILLWIGARGQEFHWKYIQKCFESNISLVQHITTSTLVWLWSRHDLHKTLVPVVLSLLALCIYKPLILEFLFIATNVGSWVSLLVKAIFTIGLGAASLQIYAGLAHSIGIS